MKSSEHILTVQGTPITVLSTQGEDYISLTDMAKHREANRTEITIQNWMRNRETIEFLGIWEGMSNPNFNHIEFDVFRKQAGLNAFVLTPTKWVTATGAIGLVTKKGKYGGGTFAHKDIAFEFGSWLSAPFKLYLIKEFQRLKDEEARTTDIDWNIRRVLAKANYRVHTDAIKDTLIPMRCVAKDKEGGVYASEADMLNMAVFGMTAQGWKQKNPNAHAQSIRDAADIVQLTVLSNLESMNATLIRDGMSMRDRYLKLSSMAVDQFKSLTQTAFIEKRVEKTVFDKQPKALSPPKKVPSVAPVDAKAKFAAMKALVNPDEFSSVTEEQLGKSLRKAIKPTSK